MTTRTASHRYIGITDDQDTCDHCAKTGLQRVVVLALLDEDGNVEDYTRYGTTCASHALAVSGGARAVDRAANFADYQTRQAAAKGRKWLAKWGVDALNLDDQEAVTAFARTYRAAQWEAFRVGDACEVRPGGVTLARWVEIVTTAITLDRRAIAEAALIGVTA